MLVRIEDKCWVNNTHVKEVYLGKQGNNEVVKIKFVDGGVHEMPLGVGLDETLLRLMGNSLELHSVVKARPRALVPPMGGPSV